MIDAVFKSLSLFVQCFYQLRGTGFYRVAEAFRGFVARNWSDYEVIIEDFCSSAAVYSDGSVNDGLPSLFKAEVRAQAVAEAEVLTLDALRVKKGGGQGEVIKLDIDGAGLHALRGGEKLIEDCRPVLIMEFIEFTAISAGYGLEYLTTWLHAKGCEPESIAGSGQRVAVFANVQIAPLQNVLALPAKCR